MYRVHFSMINADASPPRLNPTSSSLKLRAVVMSNSETESFVSREVTMVFLRSTLCHPWDTAHKVMDV